MNRYYQLFASLLLVSCAPRCDEDRRSNRATDSEEAIPVLAVETAKVRVRKVFDVPSANPVGVALQELIAATRTSCMAPCAVQLTHKKGHR